MKKKSKGEWGYIDAQRIRVFILTVILYLCSAGLYLIGYITLHTHRSLWTVFAILGILPASKSLVNLIMFLRFRSLKQDVYNEYEAAAGQMPIIYELPFTTYDKTYFVDAAACIGNTVVCCYPDVRSSGKKHEQDTKNLSEHLETVLKNDGFRDISIKIYKTRPDFINRLTEMNCKLAGKIAKEDVLLLDSLKSVSL